MSARRTVCKYRPVRPTCIVRAAPQHGDWSSSPRLVVLIVIATASCQDAHGPMSTPCRRTRVSFLRCHRPQLQPPIAGAPALTLRLNTTLGQYTYLHAHFADLFIHYSSRLQCLEHSIHSLYSHRSLLLSMPACTHLVVQATLPKHCQPASLPACPTTYYYPESLTPGRHDAHNHTAQSIQSSARDRRP